MKRAWWLLLLAACPAGNNLPGDEAMGTFEFRAEPLSVDCQLSALPSGGFNFEATVRHNKDGSHTWLTLGGVTDDAGFDGQFVTSIRQAPRVFTQADGGPCGSVGEDGGETCDSRLNETFVFALLSQSQNQALGSACPDNPLDGGVPFDPDAGIYRPGSTGTGYDAVRACGELSDSAQWDGLCATECTAAPCTLRYKVSGARK